MDTPFEQYSGGWAFSGMMTWEMCAGFVPVTTDTLVIMAGTNDVNNQIDLAHSPGYLDCIAETSGLPTDRIILSAIAPSDRLPSETLAYNAVLAEHAITRGWLFTDPWLAFRNPDGTWVPGAAYDPLHPTGATQQQVADVLRDAIDVTARPIGKDEAR
jgi:hypothetical protein